MEKYYKLLINRTWDDLFIPFLNYIPLYLLDNLYTIGAYPKIENIFMTFNVLNYEKVKVIILNQEPYCNGDSDGLAYSCITKINPILDMILTEVSTDINITKTNNPSLLKWAYEGVLLMNCSLTVEKDNSLTHLKYWEEFTDNIIKYISNNTSNKVFMLWGNYAKSKMKYIDHSKHLVLDSDYPSTINGGYLGCKHFSKCNEYLYANNIKPINWRN